MTEKEVRRILTEQTKLAVDFAEIAINRGAEVKKTMATLRADLRRILTGEIVYT